jgi:uncharacterized repeat protein (TIGR01451 family)
LPDYTTFVGPTGPNGWTPVAGTNFYRYYPGLTPGQLGPREGGKLQFVVRVVPTLPATVTVVDNLIQIGSNQPDADPNDNFSIEQTPVRAVPNLQVQKTALTPVVRPNQPVTYVITVTNQGPGTADNVVITETLPAYTTYVTDTLGVPPAGSGGGPISWSIGNLPDGGTRSFTLTLQADTNVCLSNDITNIVEAYADSQDGNPADNIDMVTSPVACRDIAINKTVNMPFSAPDRDVVFTLVYENLGLITATNTVITDTVPLSMTFMNSSPPPTSGLVNRTYRWDVADVPPGISQTIVITAHIGSGGGLCDQTLTNTTRVSAAFATGSDQHLDNNLDTAAVTVRCVPDLVVAKNDRIGGPGQPAFVQPTEIFTYSILYTNIGVGTAYGVVLTETLPNHTSFVGPAGWTQVGLTNQYT